MYFVALITFTAFLLFFYFLSKVPQKETFLELDDLYHTNKIYKDTKYLIPDKIQLKDEIYMDFLDATYKTPQKCKEQSKSKNHDCVNKAIELCTKTDPNMYLSSDKVYFPAKWIGPYKNADLSKITNISCYNKMYDCCNNLF